MCYNGTLEEVAFPKYLFLQIISSLFLRPQTSSLMTTCTQNNKTKKIDKPMKQYSIVMLLIISIYICIYIERGSHSINLLPNSHETVIIMDGEDEDNAPWSTRFIAVEKFYFLGVYLSIVQNTHLFANTRPQRQKIKRQIFHLIFYYHYFFFIFSVVLSIIFFLKRD